MTRTLFILILLFCFSCTRTIERPPAPKKLLSKEKMVEVMTEMVKLESYVKETYKQVPVYHKLMIHSGDSLLHDFDLNREVYENSINYYSSRQDEMKAIYDEVLEELNKELGKLQSEK
ncbi:MAG: DUF4296 domain-containing protein [Crocinitomicaceae bacterium]|nr:DUF4296 domain-containing protein [Crocinitomicaceae bacterium]